MVNSYKVDISLNFFLPRNEMGHCDGKTIEDGSDDDKSSDKKSGKTSKLNKIDKKQPIALNKQPIALDDILSSLNNFSISCYFKLLHFNKLHGSCDADALNHFCRMQALVDLPIAFISSELISERYHHTLPSIPHNKGLVSKPLMKNPLFFQLGILSDSPRHTNSSSLGTSPTRLSDFTGSLVTVTDALSYEPNAESSILNMPEKSPVSLSSINSPTSCISTSSPSSAVFIKGVIYSMQKNGSVCFLFKEGEGSMIYTASSRKVDCSAGIALDHLYVFHRLKGNRKPDCVGKMTVLNQLVLKPNMSRLIETEFVLFGVEENNSKMQSQGVTSSMEKGKGFSTKIPKLFKSNHQRNRPIANLDYQNIQLDDMEFIDHMKHGFEPYLEKVAIVVKSSSSPSSVKKLENGGWGLKFLEKVTKDDYIHTKKNCETSVDVLIPNGSHGVPTKGGKGPSTLIERWKSNGSCDCGGWDIGCPITVLNGEKSSHENCKTVGLFKKGTKHMEAPWKMINTGDNVYTMYFQPSLSGLEAFSIGLAIIHSQIPSL